MSSSVFLEYLTDLAQGEPGPRRVRAVWSALGRLLRREMRRRGLWSAPPRYLGVIGALSWSADRSAFDELISDCYAFIFVHRLRSLSAHAATRGEIDALVALNVRHFVHEAQKRHDPLGYRVFELLHRAARRALERGEIELPGCTSSGRRVKIRNRSLLAAPACRRDTPAVLDAARVRAWAEALVPVAVTGRGAEVDAAVEALRARLVELVLEASLVRFGDVVEPLKAETRGRWSAVLVAHRGRAVIDDGAVEVLSMVNRRRGHDELEARVDFARLVARVDRALARRPERERTRRYLHRLWTFCHTLAAEGGPLTPSDLPSQRRVARLLGIPRDRLPELFALLHREVDACRRALHRSASSSVYDREKERAQRMCE
ncbi:MAG: hypothetical protein AAGC60_18925 [Acidobacteriota bacterium]